MIEANITTMGRTIKSNIDKRVVVLEGLSPYIGDNGNWYVFDSDTQTFVDTGHKAKGDKGDTYTITAEDYEAIAELVPPYDDTEIRGEISGIQQELDEKMEFYKLDTQVNGTIVTFYHDGVQLDFEAISDKYFDNKYFVYAECLNLTFIPCFPPTETDQAIEFISTYIYGGEVMVDRLIINSNNEGKFEEKYIAEKSDLTDYVKNTDYATATKGGVVKSGNGLGISSGYTYPLSFTYPQYSALSNSYFIGKGTLENVLAERLKEPQFELIEEITLTEDTAVVERKAEPNGNPYKFSKVAITCIGGIRGDSKVLYYTVYDANNKSIAVDIAGAFGTSMKYSASRFETDGAFGMALASSATSNELGTSNIQSRYGSLINELGFITRIRLNINATVPIPSGTNIKIYAVRR